MSKIINRQPRTESTLSYTDAIFAQMNYLTNLLENGGVPVDHYVPEIRKLTDQLRVRIDQMKKQ